MLRKLGAQRKMNLKVECYSGYRGEETPRCFWMGDRKIKVVKVIDRWLSPDHRYFKILGDDQSIYILRHETKLWEWELAFFSQAESRYSDISK